MKKLLMIQKQIQKKKKILTKFKILFVFIASEPPFKITALPDLKHKLATSDVTFGLLSYITPMTPIGTDTLLIFSPLGLLHFSKVTLTGSFNFTIFLIET